MQYTKEFLRELHKNLLETRLLEEKMKDLYAEGRVPGHVHSGVGQEAAYVGTLSTRREGDYFKLTHRPTALPHMLGTSLNMLFGELLAKKPATPADAAGVCIWASCVLACWGCPAPWAAIPALRSARR